MSNYTMLHLHTHYSNPTTIADSVTKPEDYIKKAKECGMNAIAFTEHGNVYNWITKKRLADKYDIKYIHGIEAYVTEDMNKKIRDNYHVILLAKNFEGVKEINQLSSNSFQRDGHFYFNPRITFDELVNTSDNIIITTACLGGILNRGIENNRKELVQKFIQFMKQNKHRCFLEIQHHNVEEQKRYNQVLLGLHKKLGIPLVAGTDTHSLDTSHAECRLLLQDYKHIHFDNEDNWDLMFRTYDELVDAYEKQGVVPKEYYIKALENTNRIADSVEEFKLNRSHKYPKYKNADKIFKKKIAEGIKFRGVDINDPVVQERITREYEVYKNMGTHEEEYGTAIDYMLLEDDVKTWCRDVANIPYSYGRGSVTGSFIAYLMRVHEMNSIEHGLIFERFLNPERVTIADIDTDYPPSRRDEIKDYLHSKDYVYCADILTFTTLQLKGSIRAIGGALKIPYNKVNEISKNVDNNEDEYAKQYPELFKYAYILQGTVESVGTHPAGVVVSPINLEQNIGMSVNSQNPRPVSQVDMEDIEYMNFVKLDLLSLKTIEIIQKACEFAGIPMLVPDNIDAEDEAVWKDMRKDTTGIFQWSEKSGQVYYPLLFSDETLKNFREYNPDIKLMDIFSMGNGAIRPSGASYKDDLGHGKPVIYGVEPLDEFLSDRLGKLIFQEDIMGFLNKFCGLKMSEADIVRRAFSDKERAVIDSYMPKIKSGFVRIMHDEHGISKERAEEIIVDFVKVIEDASEYGFSINHSQAYSYIGYACGWLRYYYPLEFLTSAFIVHNNDKDDTIEYSNYMKNFTDITLSAPRFRFSRGDYSFSKKENTIYKGLGSIKYLNFAIAEELYKLKDNKYETFVDLLIDIEENVKNKNARQIETLIKIGYFEEFGDTNKLLLVHEQFKNGKGIKYSKTYVDKTKQKRREKLIEYEKNVEYKPITSVEKAIYELDILGYTNISDNSIPEDLAIVAKKETNQWGNVFVDLYRVHDGSIESLKIQKYTHKDNPIDELDIIQTVAIVEQPKYYNPNEMELLLNHYCKIKVE